MSAKDLVDALKDRRDRLEDDGYHVGLVEFVANEWEVKPELLERKFVEAEGVPPEKWDISAAMARRAERTIAEAKVMSRNFASKARHVEIDGRDVEITGLLVRTLKRRRVIAVAMTREGLMGIDINSSVRGNPMEKYPFDDCFGGRSKLLAQLEAAIAEQGSGKGA